MEETKKNIYTALLAQKQMGPVYKNATNPAFRSKYADLSAVIETITEKLHDNGILFVQPLTVVDGEQYIKTILAHVDSETVIDSLYKVVCKDMQDPQKVGASITHGRRYSLLSLLGLAPEDDDGNSASTSSTAHHSASQTSSRPVVQSVSHDGGDDVKCEIPSCKNTVWAAKVENSKKYNKGHVICYFHSTNGDWETLLANELAEHEPTAYDMARE